MKVAFLHAKQDPKYADIMVREVRRHMPRAELIQLTDLDTPAVHGCTVKRMDWMHENPMIFRMEHLMELEGDVLVLDTDIVVQADLSTVFRFPFDMALTWRDGPVLDPDGVDIAKLMPVNCGVMFQRNPKFWARCLEWCTGKALGWYADQLAVAANYRYFNILRLHCDNFNYKPKSENDPIAHRFAIHYRGKARPLMERRFS